MTFKRARSEDQIEKRIEEITQAAKVIFDEKGYDHLSFTAISELTKFTRPTIYKYFTTKEEILLLILLQDMKQWIQYLNNKIQPSHSYTIQEITDLWVDSLSDFNRLLDLYAILFTAIEKNVSLDALVHFKKEIHQNHEPLIGIMMQLIPGKSVEEIAGFISHAMSNALGLYAMTQLTDKQKEAIKLSGYAYQMPSFSVLYKASTYQLVYCLVNDIGMQSNG